MLEEALAEKIAITAATTVGTKIAEQIAKKAEEAEGLHGSPITEKGKAVLGTVPLCYDFRGVRSWVLTRAWQIMEKEKRARLPVGEAWSDARAICAMSPELVEVKKPNLCGLSHMEQVPLCEKYLAKEKAGVV